MTSALPSNSRPAPMAPAVSAAVAQLKSIGYRVDSFDASGVTMVIRGWRIVRVVLGVLWMAAYATRTSRVGSTLIRYGIARKPYVWVGMESGRVITY